VCGVCVWCVCVWCVCGVCVCGVCVYVCVVCVCGVCVVCVWCVCVCVCVYVYVRCVCVGAVSLLTLMGVDAYLHIYEDCTKLCFNHPQCLMSIVHIPHLCTCIHNTYKADQLRGEHSIEDAGYILVSKVGSIFLKNK